jgi:hypothetical protein
MSEKMGAQGFEGFLSAGAVLGAFSSLWPATKTL